MNSVSYIADIIPLSTIHNTYCTLQTPYIMYIPSIRIHTYVCTHIHTQAQKHYYTYNGASPSHIWQGSFSPLESYVTPTDDPTQQSLGVETDVRKLPLHCNRAKQRIALAPALVKNDENLLLVYSV